MKTSIFSVVLFLLISACQGAVKTEKESSPSQESTEQHEGSAAVQLNNGEKWQANPETTQGIQAMQQLAGNFSADAADADYASLKNNLNTEFQLIFQRCTMTGEAHNQLHNYLVPLKALLEKLDSGDPAQSKTTLELIRKYLGEYTHFFS